MGYPGTTLCGTEEDWLNGGQRNSDRNIVCDEQGYSECCGHTVPTSNLAGLAALESNWISRTGFLVDMLLSSEITWYHPPGPEVQRSEGGALGGGIAYQLHDSYQISQGGAVAGGGASQGGFGRQRAAGGAVGGGAAASGVRRPLVAAGGAVGGGTSKIQLRKAMFAAGGAVGGGSAVQVRRGPLRAAGGAVGGGHALMGRPPAGQRLMPFMYEGE